MAIDLFVRPRARQDIIDHAVYIANDNPSAAERFITSVESSCELLIENTRMGMAYDSECSRLASIRIWPVSGFPTYLIFTSRDIPPILADDQTEALD
ncbi:MAG: type II toxin-antitoxin system RelE/ParE family toxin [Candidatus Hydrogenedentes bacterium]|nr:type II toxin-antitoxin system RelE/ParE family toxin [Candidatus Hydrogenedentota bacterium]